MGMVSKLVKSAIGPYILGALALAVIGFFVHYKMLVHERDTLHADNIVLEAATDEPLDRKQRVGRICDSLALRRLPDQNFVVFAEGDDGRRRPVPFAVLDDLG